MNPQINRLYEIARKPERRIIGLMSGTSLDGLDVALCRFTGSGTDTRAEVLEFHTVIYPEGFMQPVREVFAKRHADLELVTLLNAWLGNIHAGMLLGCLLKWRIDRTTIDLVASHGQTIYHAPQHQHYHRGYSNATLQIGDGDHIATSTGIITLSDFRQKHVAAGGEGAPLAVYGDYLLFSKAGEDRVLLNMGGIANFTYLPADLDATRMFSTDVGPGNTLIDAWVRRHYSIPFDKDGAVAASGTVNQPLLDSLLGHPFFDKPFPKTTGPELFGLPYVAGSQDDSDTETLPHADVAATLTAFSAEGIARAVRHGLPAGLAPVVYMSGGGMHNPVLVAHLQRLLPGVHFHTTDALGIPPDAKEAVLFAVLANEAVAGGSLNFGHRPGIPNVTMGKISLPG